MSKHAPDGLVVAGLVLEPDRRGGVAKLVHGDAQAGRLFDPFGDLIAEGLGVLAAAGLAGE